MIVKKVQKGQVITADLINNIIDSIRECQIQSGVGYSFSRNSGGTTLSIKSSISGNVAVTEQCPFDVTTELATSGMNVSLALGTVNGLMPSNNFDKISASTSGKKYVVINCESNGKNVTTASWDIQNSIPVPPLATIDVAPSSFSVLVAVISGTTVYKTIPCSNIAPRVAPSIQEDRAEYVAGERNYNQYYQWVF